MGLAARSQRDFSAAVPLIGGSEGSAKRGRFGASTYKGYGPMSILSRRAVLRGAGVAMALPWLESLSVCAHTSTAFPKRFAVLFMGNGISGNHWLAKGAGAELTLGRSLAP